MFRIVSPHWGEGSVDATMVGSLGDADFSLSTDSTLGGVPIRAWFRAPGMGRHGAPGLTLYRFYLRDGAEVAKFHSGDMVELRP